MSAELLSRLNAAARARVPLVVVQRDGERVAGRVVEVAITFAVVRGTDGADKRVTFAEVVEVVRKDGRRFWPPARGEGATP